MTALAADRLFNKRGGGNAISVPLAAATQVWQGGLVAANASGYGVPAASTAGLRVRGICTASVDNTGSNAGAYAPVLTNVFVLLNNSGTHAVVQSDVGHPCWVQDDNTVCGGAGGSSVLAGIVSDFDAAGNVYVWISDSTGHDNEVAAEPESIIASGALSTTVGSELNSATGVQADTLANGTYEGQRKWIFMVTAGNNAVVTPATFAHYTTITFSAAKQCWLGEWHSDGWHTVIVVGAALA